MPTSVTYNGTSYNVPGNKETGWQALSNLLIHLANTATPLSTLTDGNIIVGNGSNVATSVAMSGDITISNAGVTTIGASKIDDGMLNLTTPALGTPASGVLTNATGLPISTGVAGLGSGVATFLATPSSANLASAVTDETGTGSLVLATSPTLVTPALGTPSALVLTNATSLPEAQVTNHEAAIDHDALTNFVANEHIDWTSASSAFSTTSSITSTASTGNSLVLNTDGLVFDAANKRLGLGTASPTRLLHLVDTATTSDTFHIDGVNTSGHTAYIYSNSVQTGNTLRVYQDGATSTGAALYVHTDASTAGIFIGNVGIGLTNPGHRLTVKGSGNSVSTASFLCENSDGTNILEVDDGGNVIMEQVYGHDMNGETYRDLLINNSGELGYDSSTGKKKNIINNMENVDWLFDLPLYVYRYKDKKDKLKSAGHTLKGATAEDVEKGDPTFVFYNEDGTVEGIHDRKLVYPLIKAVQQLNERLKMLENV